MLENKFGLRKLGRINLGHEKVGHRKEMNIVFELLTCIFPIAYENERCDMKAIAHSVHASGKPLTYPGASKDCLSIGGISWNIDLDNLDSWWRCQEAGASQVLVFPQPRNSFGLVLK